MCDPSKQEQAEETFVRDDMWITQQKKTFTAWTNSHLRKKNLHIEDLFVDLVDGKKLHALLEVMGGERLPLLERGKMRLHNVTNVNICLKYIASKNVRLAGVGAEEIVDQNVKMTLGLIWTLILRFSLADFEGTGGSLKDGLLLWCQKKTNGYPGVHVRDFHNSWQDGLAFCALIHKHRPELLDFNQLDKDNAEHNLGLAFDIADKHLDVPRMLDIEDVISCPDEKSVITYISALYQVFSQSKQIETAVSSLEQMLVSHKDVSDLTECYEGLCSDLLKWIEETVPWLEQRPEQYEDILQRSKEYEQHTRSAKPPRYQDKSKLEDTYHKLQTKLNLQNRSPYVAPGNLDLHEIQAVWKCMETEEQKLYEYLIYNLRRLERLEHLWNKFQYKCKKHEEWEVGKLETLVGDFSTRSYAELAALHNKYATYKEDLSGRDSRIMIITNLKDELVTLGFSDIDSVNTRYDQVTSSFNNLKTKSAEYAEELEQAYEKAKIHDDLCVSLSKAISSYKPWLEESSEDVDDIYRVHSIGGCQKLIEEHEKFIQSLPAADKKFEEILRLFSEVRAVYPDQPYFNTYSDVTKEELESKNQLLKNNSDRRTSDLQAELMRQSEIDKASRDFAAITSLIESKVNEVSKKLSVILASPAEIEDQLKKVQGIKASYISELEPDLKESDRIYALLKEANVIQSEHTTFTGDSIFLTYQSVLRSIDVCIAELEGQLLIKQSAVLTAAEMKELRSSFSEFDRDSSNHLDRLELRSFLVANNLMHKIESDEEYEILIKKIEHTGDMVSFGQILNFITSQKKQQDTADKMSQSFAILAGDKDYISQSLIYSSFPKHVADFAVQKMSKYTGSDASAPEDALDYKSCSASLYGESDM